MVPGICLSFLSNLILKIIMTSVLLSVVRNSSHPQKMNTDMRLHVDHVSISKYQRIFCAYVQKVSSLSVIADKVATFDELVLATTIFFSYHKVLFQVNAEHLLKTIIS